MKVLRACSILGLFRVPFNTDGGRELVAEEIMDGSGFVI